MGRNRCIGGVVDLGALATEFLILGLDPYPRKPGAVFEPPQDVKPDPGPFAALAGLKDRAWPLNASCVRAPNRYSPGRCRPSASRT